MDVLHFSTLVLKCRNKYSLLDTVIEWGSMAKRENALTRALLAKTTDKFRVRIVRARGSAFNLLVKWRFLCSIAIYRRR